MMQKWPRCLTAHWRSKLIIIIIKMKSLQNLLVQVSYSISLLWEAVSPISTTAAAKKNAFSSTLHAAELRGSVITWSAPEHCGCSTGHMSHLSRWCKARHTGAWLPAPPGGSSPVLGCGRTAPWWGIWQHLQGSISKLCTSPTQLWMKPHGQFTFSSAAVLGPMVTVHVRRPAKYSEQWFL